MPVVPRNAVGGNIGGAWSNFEVTDVATGETVSTSIVALLAAVRSAVTRTYRCPLRGNSGH